MKRIVSIVLALLVCITSMGMFGIFADGEATVQASTAQGTAGDTVEVALTMTGNPGISYLKLRIGYDKDALTLTAVENTGGLGEAEFTASQDLTYNPYVLTWASAGNFSGNGVIAKLTFKVNENAASGSTAVTVECADCNNQDLQDVTVATANGGVEITSVKPEFILGNGGGAIGGTVEVSLRLNNNPGISYFKVQIGYDAEKLELKEIKKTNPSFSLVLGPLQKNPYTIVFATSDGFNQDPAVNGEVCKVVFNVKDNTRSIGTTDLDLIIVEVDHTNGPGDISNITERFNGVDGMVTINDVDCEHNFETITFVDNNEHKKICSICHREYFEAHTWDNGEQTKAPTCTEAGETTYHCSVCNGSKTEAIPAALGHDWGEWEMTTEPGCETKGVETRTCKRDPSHTETREVAALGHDWGEWKVTKEPGCETEGEETRICTRDESHTETRKVDALGHSFTNYVYNNDATKTKDGTETAECDHGCGTKDTRTKPGTKLPDDNPATGDAGWWIAGIALVSLAGIGAVTYYKKKVQD